MPYYTTSDSDNIYTLSGMAMTKEEFQQDIDGWYIDENGKIFYYYKVSSNPE